MTNYVWSIDDPGLGGDHLIASVPRMCQALELRGVRATWFAVPKPRGERLSEEWKRALCAARDAGHDIQLHGLTHAACYEFGPPTWPATTISPEMSPKFESRRDEYLARYTVENLRAWIE